jgi:2-dehydropantoate 2-reductase
MVDSPWSMVGCLTEGINEMKKTAISKKDLTADHPKFLVIGAGVNGSACASILQRSGIDVTLMARGQRVDDLRNDGVIIENPLTGKRTVTRVPVVDRLAPDDLYDYVLIIMRKNQALELLPVLARNRSPSFVFMGNTLTGPEPYMDALGKDRVLMGSVYAGGRREGKVIRAIVLNSVAASFGEPDGGKTPRLKRMVAALNRGISRAEISTRIVDRQITHASAIPPLGNLLIKHGCDARALAKSTADLYLLVDAMREAHKVIRAAGYRIEPAADRLTDFVPRFLMVAMFRILFSSKIGEVGAAYHVSQAPDEMRHLSRELGVLVEKSGLAVPALRKTLALQV